MEEMFFSERRKMDILEKTKKLGKYKSKRIAFEQYRKVLKAKLMKEAMLSGVSSVQAQEREAYADPSYEELLDALEMAVRIETELFYELKIFDVEVQVWRTQQANKRNDI
jgi:hypothetical protein|tara:strand:- start:75799 stop:76128 length:330 start_codon:yes stop_codon:yes gene_type:complete